MRSILLAGDRLAALTALGSGEKASPTRMALTRRATLARGAASIAGLAAPSIVRAEASRTLRFIPTVDLLSLDPVWTAADSTRNHANMIYDQLYGLDAGFTPHPQMVSGHRIEDDGLTWNLTLRDGLKFHDGTPVLARDCVATIVRWGKRDPYGTALMARTAEVAAPSDRVIRFRLKQPFASLPEALAQPACVMMPERVAKTDPFTQITDPTGSGPFRFVVDERLSGVRAVYTKFEGYVPRPDGTASFLAGPRVVHFDRAVFTVVPDAATAAVALTNGEFDWWESPSFDLVGILRAHRDIRVEVKNRLGFIGCLRFNHLHKPFDNVAVRRLVLACVSQSDFMQAVAGAQPELFRTKVGLFAPGHANGERSGDRGADGADRFRQGAKGPRGGRIWRREDRLVGFGQQPWGERAGAGGGRSVAAHGVRRRFPIVGFWRIRAAPGQQEAARDRRLAYFHHRSAKPGECAGSRQLRDPERTRDLARLAGRAQVGGAAGGMAERLITGGAAAARGGDTNPVLPRCDSRPAWPVHPADGVQ